MKTNELNKTQKVKNALLLEPYLIKHYLKRKDYDKKITKGILRKMLPLRSSIEIECISSLKINCSISNYSLLKKGVIDLDDDNNTCINEYCEHRISICDYKQALGLYNILKEMKKYCKLNPISGTHIHIDYSSILCSLSITDTDSFYHILRDEFDKELDTVYQIFGSKYNGVFNRKITRINYKGSWISIRTNLRSIEYRIGDCTFEYNEIIKQMIDLNKLTIKVFKRAKTIYMKKKIYTKQEQTSSLRYCDIIF